MSHQVRERTHFVQPLQRGLIITLNWAQRISSSPNKQKSPSENLFEPNVHLIIIRHCQQHLGSLQGNHRDNKL